VNLWACFAPGVARRMLFRADGNAELQVFAGSELRIAKATSEISLRPKPTFIRRRVNFRKGELQCIQCDNEIG
jgi:hypothetical protein